MESSAAPAQRACQNCGAPMLGDHCYACGQPVKGLVRHFGSILGDFFDSVFDLDSRMLRTVGPLMFRPGYLSLEYFAGHRVRFVSPVRLFVFLCIAAFFVLKLVIDTPVEIESEGDFARADTVEQVEAARKQAVQGMQEGLAAMGDSPGRAGMEAGIGAINAEADRRIEWIKSRDAARAQGLPEPPPPSEVDDELSFNGQPWHPETNPIRIDFLPEAANAQLNAWAARGKDNIQRVQRDPGLIKDAFIESLPQTFFVLLPLFALLLKLFYVFKRRLYMEHLIVALHSHAFLCVAVIAAVGLDLAGEWAGAESVAGQTFGIVEGLMFAWMPIYLWIMQKRVYGQGVILTTLKFSLLGIAYVVLLSLGAAFNFVFSLVTL